MQVVNIDEIKANSRGYFFSEGANKFFKSRDSETGIKTCLGEYFFVTSEILPGSDKRVYTIRHMTAQGYVSTHGSLGEYSDRRTATAAMKCIVKELESAHEKAK